jgi:hypothetical protein
VDLCDGAPPSTGHRAHAREEMEDGTTPGIYGLEKLRAARDPLREWTTMPNMEPWCRRPSLANRGAQGRSRERGDERRPG